ncbi:MAG: glycosyltransferase family 2 protein [Candidatus Krumholzibacteria bacterium]|nr:glycosyltransferase family 2 protein [Candidatus Krumholzibacteria bacterium]
MIASSQTTSSTADPAHTLRVAIIVLTWNGKALTLDCLESLVALDHMNTDIIVVDNASADGTPQAIEQRYGDRITVIVNEQNLGYSQGNNVGITHALDTGAGYILLLNNDTIVDRALVDNLLYAFATHARTGIAGPKIYFASPPDQIWFAGGEVSLAKGTARHIGIRHRDVGQFDSMREVDYVSGCALIAKREVFQTIGLLDPSYRAYFEDTDFCMRARRHGFEIRYVPAAKVWHRVSSSVGGQLSWRKMSQKFKSTLRFFARYSSLHHWLTIPLFFAFDVVRIVALVLRGRIRNVTDVENASGSGGDQP